MLRSRDRELAAIERLCGSARAGQGGGLLLVGEPGIGKSALLIEAQARARDMRLLTATAVEAESALGDASLQLLLRHLVAHVGEHVAALPPPESRALRVAFGREDGDPPEANF